MGGLLGVRKDVYMTKAASILLMETTSIPLTISILLSVSSMQSGSPNLYSVEVGRLVNNLNAPNIRVKVLSGSYVLKLAYTNDENGAFKLYLKRGTTTPVVWAKMLCEFGCSKGLSMTEVTADLSSATEVEES